MSYSYIIIINDHQITSSTVFINIFILIFTLIIKLIINPINPHYHFHKFHHNHHNHPYYNHPHNNHPHFYHPTSTTSTSTTSNITTFTIITPECKKTLSGESYYSKDNQHYCKNDYQRLFVVRCVVCGEYIEGEVVTALNTPYHPGCFKCTQCGNRISAGKKVTLKDGMHLCPSCDQERINNKNNNNNNDNNNNNNYNNNNNNLPSSKDIISNNNNINNRNNNDDSNNNNVGFDVGGRNDVKKTLDFQNISNNYNNNVNKDNNNTVGNNNTTTNNTTDNNNTTNNNTNINTNKNTTNINNNITNNTNIQNRNGTPKKALLNENMKALKNAQNFGGILNGGGYGEGSNGGGGYEEGSGYGVGMVESPVVVGDSHFINSPESDYSMELKNLTESSIDEALMSPPPTTSTPGHPQKGHHHHNHHHLSHNLHHHHSNPRYTTPQYKSNGDAFIDANQRNTEDETVSCRCVSPESTFSKKSKESCSSEPMRKSNTLSFGPYLKGSYLEKVDNYRRSPSCNPSIKENIPLHYHRPQDFSYRKERPDIKKPGRKSGMKFSFATPPSTTTTTSPGAYVPRKEQEVIQLSKQPDAKVFDESKVAAIERDDFPAPPNPAAIWPELLREHNIRSSSRSSSRRGGMNDDDDEEEEEDEGDDDDLEDVVMRKSRMQKDIQELSKMQGSGTASLMLKDMRNRQFLLDPRSASRTPSAAREPPFKTRFTSPVYASPSRDLLMRSQLQHYDDFEPKYRTCGTPMPSSLGVKIDYRKLNKRVLQNNNNNNSYYNSHSNNHYNYHSQDLLSWQQLMMSQRPESTDGCLETTRGGSSREGMTDGYSQYSSHSDYLDHDPITGLKCHRPSRLTYEGRCTPISVLSHQLPREETMHKTFEYDQLKVTSENRPSHLDEAHLEHYLQEDEFERVLGMNRFNFHHLPSWKQNDIKKRLELFN